VTFEKGDKFIDVKFEQSHKKQSPMEVTFVKKSANCENTETEGAKCVE